MALLTKQIAHNWIMRVRVPPVAPISFSVEEIVRGN